MALILDLAVVVILILTAIAGWRKGLLRYVISSVGTVAAIIIAFLLADIITPTVYEKWIQPDIRDFIQERVEGFDIAKVVSDEIEDCGYNVKLSDKQLDEALSSQGDISAALAEFAQKNGASSDKAKSLKSDMEEFFETRFPGKFNGLFTNADNQKPKDGIEYTKAQAYDVVRALADKDTDSGVSYIEYNLVRPFVITAIKIIMTIALFIVISLVVKMIFAVAGIFDHVPVANGLNRFLGFLAGIVKGALYLLVIALGVSVLISTAGDTFGKLNTATIDKTLLFRHLFYLFYDI